MKTIYKGLFMCLCVMLALVAPAVAEEPVGKGTVTNVKPVIKSIVINAPTTTDFKIGSNQYEIVVTTEDRNTFGDISSLALKITYDDNEVLTLPENFNKVADPSDGNVAIFYSYVDVESTWCAGKYKITATVEDNADTNDQAYSGLIRSDLGPYEYLEVQDFKAISCTNAMFYSATDGDGIYDDKLAVESDARAVVTVTNDGNMKYTGFTFDFNNLEQEGVGDDYIDGNSVTSTNAGTATLDIKGTKLADGTTFYGGDGAGTVDLTFSIDPVPSVMPDTYSGIFSLTPLNPTSTKN